MFYDESATDWQPMSFLRLTTSVATAVLVPPFIALAVVPMTLMLIPVAFVAIPFMIPAFFPAAHSTTVETKQLESWRPPMGMALGHAGHR